MRPPIQVPYHKKPKNAKQAIIAIVNPTAIRNKHEEFRNLMDLHGVNTICCSENTATKEVQKVMTGKLSRLKLASVWSPPVLPQREKCSNQPSLRGRAGGTSIHTLWPMRPGYSSQVEHDSAPDRLVHAVMQWGGMYVQVVTIYGYAGNATWHKQATNHLFNLAVQKTEAINLPAIFLGDFNMDVQQLDLFNYLASKGYMSLQQLHEHMYGYPMPCTCKNVTTPDTAILPPVLIERLTAIKVDKQGLFDTHDPVIFAIEIPEFQIFHQRIATPKSWVELPVDQTDIAEAAETTCQYSEPTDLEDWANLVEDTVDTAIRNLNHQNPQLYTLTHLPKHHRGRCRPVKIRQIPLVTPAKKARDGDFNPIMECASYRSKHFVRQIRRLHSLCLRLKRLASQTDIWPRTIVGLWQEWASILSWKDQSRSFYFWACDHPELWPFPTGLPDLTWLETAEQFLQHELTDLLYHEQKFRHKKSKLQHLIDCHDNYKKAAYAAVRCSDFQPFKHVYKTVEDTAIAVATETQNEYECFVDQASRFRTLLPIQVEGVEAKVLDVQEHFVKISMPTRQETLPEQISLKQEISTFHQKEVFDELTGYWTHFWNRPARHEEEEFFAHFQLPPPTCPQLADNFEDCLDDWRTAISKCNSHSAPGVDGFTFQELKMLPDKLLRSLVVIISNLQEFPAHFMIARAVPLPKKGKLTAENSRPITILATLYQVWSKVCTTRCLRHLSRYVSSTITGFLPNRGAHDASYAMQAVLEVQRYFQRHITGLTLDLRKCFNLLNRRKVAMLLVNFGIPARLVQKWLHSLQHLTRVWDVDKNVSEFIPSTTGCPEGDAWSVVSMICVSETWSRYLSAKHADITTMAYADNWTLWLGNAQLRPEPVFDTDDFVRWMGLEISWSKTWVWSTDSEGSRRLLHMLQDFLQEEDLRAMLTATDLGCQITYHGHSKLGILHDRFEQAGSRLLALKHYTWVLPLKCHLVHTSVLPLALYGVELHVVGQRHLDTLRTQIADSLAGETLKSMSSAIMVNCACKKSLDPHFQALCLAVKAARKFLYRTDEATKADFLKILSMPSKHIGKSLGPVTALHEYLQRVGLTCSADGWIAATAFRKCHLLDDSFADLHRYLTWAWQDQLLLLQTQRTKLYKLPPN